MHNPHLIPFFIFGTLLIIVFAFAVIVSLIIQKRRQFRNRQARQQLAFDYSQSLLTTRIEVQETTLNMVAQELHDNITQMLTGCFMQIANAGDYMKDPKGKEIIEEAKGNVKDVIRDVRLLSHSLATGMVERRDLQDAIQAELNRIQAFSNINCTLHSESVHEPEPDQRLLLFRVVQEALQNVLKHAAAKHISIEIRNTDDHYGVAITDDGRGFEMEGMEQAASLGLINMKDRVAMLKGILTITSSPGKGTTIDIQIPLKPQA